MANIDNVQLPDGSSYNIVDNTSGFASQSYVDSAVSSVTKTTIGLGNVDNTSDLNKPISTATQTALDTLDEDKADKTDIATVESGTTASRAYSVGELVYVSGTLYRVKTAIASGATFTPGTNVEVTNVSNAIGDKGSVSVTGNGSKTYGTLFNELYALVDQSKITPTSKMSIGAEFASLDTFVLNERMFFGRVYAMATTLGGVTYRVKPSGSEYLQSYVTGSPVILGLNNITNNVPTNGTVITIYY